MPILKLLTGPAIGREFAVDGSRTIIGRHPQCEVVLDSAAVSRQHAQIMQVGEEFFVEDLGSRNGTYLNGGLIEELTKLHEGDEVQLSDTKLQFGHHATKLAGTDDSFEIAPSSPSSRLSGSSESSGSSGSKALEDSDRSVEVELDPLALDANVPIGGDPADRQTIEGPGIPEDAGALGGATSGRDLGSGDSAKSQYVINIGDEFDDEERSFAAPFDLESSSMLGDLQMGPPAGDAPPLDSSSIKHKMGPQDVGTGLRRSGSATKLKAVLEIAKALTGILDIDEVLPRTLQTLFRTFPQAEQGYILLQDTETGRLMVKASQARTIGSSDGVQPEHVAVSMTVVRHAMSSGQSLITSNAQDDTRFRSSTSVSQLQIRSIMCVPLTVVSEGGESRSIGVIQLDTRQREETFGPDDLELLNAVAAQVAMAVENAEMHAALLSRREMERDLEFATQVQRGFLPNERPQIQRYSFSDYYEAAKSVGGDYYDYINLPDGRIAIVLGDVAGKGVSAALLMARLYSSSRYQFLTHGDPAKAVTELNADIVDSGMGARFITFVAMVLDPENDKLTFANAGHMPPLLRTPSGAVTTISSDVSRLPLGIMPDQQYQSMTIDFPEGSAVLAFTDGVTEALDADHEMFGKDRLAECFAEFGPEGSDIGDAIRRIVHTVEGFSSGQFDRDDTCLVGFLRRPQRHGATADSPKP